MYADYADQINHDQLQHGKYWSVLFTYNPNTELFFDENWFPYMRDEYKDLRGWMKDHIDNGFYYGTFDQDSVLTIGFKNGNVLVLDEGTEPTREIQRKVTLILSADTKKLPLFVIYDNAYDTMFWFNGEEGLNALQEYTGWFDMTVYEDTWL